jgi:hypothetical protein
VKTPTSGHRLYSSAESASEGLREMFEETRGVDDLPPEAVTATQVEDEEIGTYHGRFPHESKTISFIVAPLGCV